jgi:hypothetical protein
MKTDKWKNKSKARFLKDEDLHGKPERRKVHREEQKLRNKLKNADIHQLLDEELDD